MQTDLDPDLFKQVLASEPSLPNKFRVEGAGASIKDGSYRIIYEISLVNYPDNSEQSLESFLVTILPMDHAKT